MSTLETLWYLAVVLATAIIFSKILGKIHFPDVTGYLLGGILIGPMVLGLVPKNAVHGMEILSEIALAIIAFSIGAEMRLSALKTTGKGIFIITVMQVVTTFLAVFLSLWALGQSIAFSLVLGSIACATAPAATLLVIRQYKAKGPVVNTLIPVVALDDALCIIAFGICASIAQALIGGIAINLNTALIAPFTEIALSILLGAAAGVIGTVVLRFIKTEGELTAFVLGSVLLLASASLKFHLSSLLVMMTFGLALANLSREGVRSAKALDGLTAPLFMCFFTLSGADLDFTVFGGVGIVAAAYIISRIIGKISGASLGAKMCAMDKNIQKYLGMTLIPQAGVAIGLSLAAVRILGPESGGEIRAIVLAATVVYELIGPVITKIALIKAGEIQTNKN